MKKLLFVLSFSLTSIISYGQNIIYDTIQYAKEYHQKRLALFKNEPIIKGKIIFLGNSITEFGNWQKLLNDSSLINRGIAGDNTFGILARLEDVISRQPSKLFIKIGINDISQNIPEQIILDNILAIVHKVKSGSPSTQIFVHSILPTNDSVRAEYPDAYNKNQHVVFINKKLKRISNKNRFVYIDLYEQFHDRNGKLLAKYADNDGLHLNPAGYQLWIEILKKGNYL